MLAKDLKPGMVIVWDRKEKELALCVSFETPAGTVPMPEAKKYCEPGFVILKHQRDDRWLETHQFSYALFGLRQNIEVNDSVRVQHPKRTGKFLDEFERIKAMNP